MFKPTPPQPNTATVEPGLTLAVFITAPYPVSTAQLINAARSSGISLGITTAPDAGTTTYSANEATVKK
ncbi:unannotated protein [freshwater metagenome]|uniref:Unannotated protein n=1 Tax=freshwater metagenome TaxID=449393 RepID=A0A6J7U4Q2_9ZZZZ